MSVKYFHQSEIEHTDSGVGPRMPVSNEGLGWDSPNNTGGHCYMGGGHTHMINNLSIFVGKIYDHRQVMVVLN